MKKITICLALLICVCLSVTAQKSLTVQGVSPQLYLVHEIAPKENFYSLGRLYNFPPRELATYNNLVFEKGLTLGQSIKIPLTVQNFSQMDDPKPEEAFVPIYHVVQAKEGLYRVSVNYNKVPLEVLKRWNNLKSDVVSNGNKLIVGYLRVLKDQSPLASKGVSIKTNEVAVKKEEKKEILPDHQTDRLPMVKNPDLAKEQPKKDDVKEEPKKEVVKEEPKKVVVREEPKNEVIKEQTNPSITNGIKKEVGSGAFQQLYADQKNNRSLVSASGSAGVFKTTSGWTDGKYYCFLNEAQPGTIVRITNNSTNKSIYAKVLDAIPDLKQNEGLLLRVSNSAAEQLGAGESRFDCSITYPK